MPVHTLTIHRPGTETTHTTRAGADSAFVMPPRSVSDATEVGTGEFRSPSCTLVTSLVKPGLPPSARPTRSIFRLSAQGTQPPYLTATTWTCGGPPTPHRRRRGVPRRPMLTAHDRVDPAPIPTSADTDQCQHETGLCRSRAGHFPTYYRPHRKTWEDQVPTCVRSLREVREPGQATPGMQFFATATITDVPPRWRQMAHNGGATRCANSRKGRFGLGAAGETHPAVRGSRAR